MGRHIANGQIEVSLHRDADFSSMAECSAWLAERLRWYPKEHYTVTVMAGGTYGLKGVLFDQIFEHDFTAMPNVSIVVKRWDDHPSFSAYHGTNPYPGNGTRVFGNRVMVAAIRAIYHPLVAS
jgi:hypothetical protein